MPKKLTITENGRKKDIHVTLGWELRQLRDSLTAPSGGTFVSWNNISGKPLGADGWAAETGFDGRYLQIALNGADIGNVPLFRDNIGLGTEDDVQFRDIAGRAGTFTSLLRGESLRTDTGKIHAPTDFQFRNASDTGYRAIWAGQLGQTSTAGIFTSRTLIAEANQVDQRQLNEVIGNFSTAFGSGRDSYSLRHPTDAGSNLQTLWDYDFSTRRLGFPGKLSFFDDLSLAGADIQTDHFSDWFSVNPTGWRVTYSGMGDFRALFIDELIAKAFTVDVAQALAGSDFLTKSVSLLAESFVVPPVAGNVTIKVEDLPGFPGFQVFENNDWVRLRLVDRSGGGLTIGDVWGQVTNYLDLGGGEQSWTFTVDYAGALDVLVGQTINKGTLVLDYGQSGDTYIERTVLDRVGNEWSKVPYDRIVRWTGSDPRTGTKQVLVQRGNLNGLAGYNTPTFGMFGTDTVFIGDTSRQNNFMEFTDGQLQVNAEKFLLSAVDATGGIRMDSEERFFDLVNAAEEFLLRIKTDGELPATVPQLEASSLSFGSPTFGTNITPSDSPVNGNTIDISVWDDKIPIEIKFSIESHQGSFGEVLIQASTSSLGGDWQTEEIVQINTGSAGVKPVEIFREFFGYNSLRMRVVLTDGEVSIRSFDGTAGAPTLRQYEQRTVVNNKGIFARVSPTRITSLSGLGGGTTTFVESSISSWSEISGKPFETIGTGLTVSGGALAFNTTFGDGRYGRLAAANTWTGLNTLTRQGENTEVLRLNIERAWRFIQRASAGDTRLALQSLITGKDFDIEDSDGNWITRVRANTGSSRGFEIDGRLVVGGSTAIDPNRNYTGGTGTFSGVVTAANATADGHLVNRITGDGRWGQLTEPNTWTNSNTFSSLAAGVDSHTFLTNFTGSNQGGATTALALRNEFTDNNTGTWLRFTNSTVSDTESGRYDIRVVRTNSPSGGRGYMEIWGNAQITGGFSSQVRIGNDGVDLRQLRIGSPGSATTTISLNRDYFGRDGNFSRNLFVEGGLFAKEFVVDTTRVFLSSRFGSGGVVAEITDATVGSEKIKFHDQFGNDIVPFADNDLLLIQERTGVNSGTIVKSIKRRVVADGQIGNVISLTTSGATTGTDVGTIAVGDQAVLDGNTTNTARDSFIEVDVLDRDIAAFGFIDGQTDFGGGSEVMRLGGMEPGGANAYHPDITGKVGLASVINNELVFNLNETDGLSVRGHIEAMTGQLNNLDITGTLKFNIDGWISNELNDVRLGMRSQGFSVEADISLPGDPASWQQFVSIGSNGIAFRDTLESFPASATATVNIKLPTADPVEAHKWYVKDYSNLSAGDLVVVMSDGSVTPPSTPGAPSFCKESNALIISWDSVANASTYDVERRVNFGSWTSWRTGLTNTNVGDTQPKDNPSDDYSYRVRACNAGGCSSYGSSAGTTWNFATSC